jgi:hypothetical protein
LKRFIAQLVIALIVAVPAFAATGQDAGSASVAVGPQYGTTHVYVAPDQMDRFVASFIATFGGRASKPAEIHVTPEPSTALGQFVATPLGALSVFGYTTPIPYPFGEAFNYPHRGGMSAPSWMSRRRDSPRHMTIFPGGGSLARAR